MKISIVIPVYNVEEYIEGCLQSVAAQTYEGEMECIVVDDCTPDGSCAVVEHFLEDYKGNVQFKFIHHEVNGGLSAARNTGICNATGDYILFLDSDDEITPTAIKLLAEPLKERNYDFVIGDYGVDGSDYPFSPLLLPHGVTLEGREIFSAMASLQWYMMAWNKLCNLSFLRANNLYFKEGLLNEDNLWSFCLANSAGSMHVVKRVTYKYKVRGSSIMGKINSYKAAEAFSIIASEAYEWARKRGLLYRKDVWGVVAHYRAYALECCFFPSSLKERKRRFLLFRDRLCIDVREARKNGRLKFLKLKEVYNSVSPVAGFWLLQICRALKMGKKRKMLLPFKE